MSQYNPGGTRKNRAAKKQGKRQTSKGRRQGRRGAIAESLETDDQTRLRYRLYVKV